MDAGARAAGVVHAQHGRRHPLDRTGLLHLCRRGPSGGIRRRDLRMVTPVRRRVPRRAAGVDTSVRARRRGGGVRLRRAARRRRSPAGWRSRNRASQVLDEPRRGDAGSRRRHHRRGCTRIRSPTTIGADSAANPITDRGRLRAACERIFAQFTRFEGRTLAVRGERSVLHVDSLGGRRRQRDEPPASVRSRR